MRMPHMGVSMREGTIVRWFKAVGDTITKGEVLLEIMTDKVEMEIESPYSGVVTEILAQEGEVVPCLEPIARIRQESNR